eukprot:5951913-Prymnesium_polylepis.1
MRDRQVDNQQSAPVRPRRRCGLRCAKAGRNMLQGRRGSTLAALLVRNCVVREHREAGEGVHIDGLEAGKGRRGLELVR